MDGRQQTGPDDPETYRSTRGDAGDPTVGLIASEQPARDRPRELTDSTEPDADAMGCEPYEQRSHGDRALSRLRPNRHGPQHNAKGNSPGPDRRH